MFLKKNDVIYLSDVFRIKSCNQYIWSKYIARKNHNQTPFTKMMWIYRGYSGTLRQK